MYLLFLSSWFQASLRELETSATPFCFIILRGFSSGSYLILLSSPSFWSVVLPRLFPAHTHTHGIPRSIWHVRCIVSFNFFSAGTSWIPDRFYDGFLLLLFFSVIHLLGNSFNAIAPRNGRRDPKVITSALCGRNAANWTYSLDPATDSCHGW